MIGGSSAPYLARTPCVPLFCTSFNRGGETEGLLDYQGRAGDHFHHTVVPSPGHIRCRKFLGWNFGLVDVSDILIFLYFSHRRGRRGSPKRWEGGVDFYWNSQKGGGSPGRGGAEGPGKCLRQIVESGGEEGFFFFFSGPKCPPSFGFPSIPGVTPRISLRIGLSYGLGCECNSKSCSENTLEFRELLQGMVSALFFFQHWGGLQTFDRVYPCLLFLFLALLPPDQQHNQN